MYGECLWTHEFFPMVWFPRRKEKKKLEIGRFSLRARHKSRRQKRENERGRDFTEAERRLTSKKISISDCGFSPATRVPQATKKWEKGEKFTPFNGLITSLQDTISQRGICPLTNCMFCPIFGRLRGNLFHSLPAIVNIQIELIHQESHFYSMPDSSVKFDTNMSVICV